MKHTVVTLLSFVASLLLAPAYGDISGTVKNSGGTGVSGVAVKVVVDTTINATTAGDGSFTLVIPTVSTQKPAVPARTFHLGIQNGLARIQSSERAVISLGLYNVQGRQVSFQKNVPIQAGITDFPLQIPAASGIYFLQARGLKFSGVLKILSFERNIISTNLRVEGAIASPAPAKTQAAGDVAIAAVPTSGYFSACATAPNPTTGLQITLKDIPAGSVTMIANVFCDNHTGESTKKAYCTALGGDAAFVTEFNDIINNYWPAGGLDADAARILQKQFVYRMQYTITGSQMTALSDGSRYAGLDATSLTGTVTQANGVKVFDVASYTGHQTFNFPAKMLKPDTPFVMPGKSPLVLNVGAQTLNCIYVAPGKFLMGQPYYMIKSWPEDPPHMVTLTKGYYIAEVPITYELYQAATGTDIRTGSENIQAAAYVTCKNVVDFITAVRADNPGKVIRRCTSAELMYATRVGTSNTPFVEKLSGPNIVSVMTAPAKATSPNPWGLYAWEEQGYNGGFERTSDWVTSEHNDVIDPVYPVAACIADPTSSHQHPAFNNGNYNIGEFEYCNQTNYLVRERILVEE